VAYQRGLWHLRKATADDNSLAGKFFQQAIDLEPTFSAAYGGLAIARTAAADFQGLPLSEIENAVDALARRAVALDPGNSEALSFLASIMYRRGDFDGALAEAKTALAISPNLAQAHGVFDAILVFSGRPKEGLAALERYNKLDPRGPRRVIRLNQIALGLYFCREYEAAAEMARDVIRENPDYPHSYRWLAAACLASSSRPSCPSADMSNAAGATAIAFSNANRYTRVATGLISKIQSPLDGLSGPRRRRARRDTEEPPTPKPPGHGSTSSGGRGHSPRSRSGLA
jgi:tetratricopeptide (TPR) repeat protein